MYLTEKSVRSTDQKVNKKFMATFLKVLSLKCQTQHIASQSTKNIRLNIDREPLQKSIERGLQNYLRDVCQIKKSQLSSKP